ncbi:MAG: hypothetical protein HC912_04105 [Saprospiraceae bacterium]|nr:hypothetical protein [Saprospiraceae bacterium]
MVATLYDASLDQFAANTWNEGFNPYLTSGAYLRLNAKHFNSVSGRDIQPYYYNGDYPTTRSYTTFNWFGFDERYSKYRSYEILSSVAQTRIMAKSSRVEDSVEMAMSAAPMEMQRLQR